MKQAIQFVILFFPFVAYAQAPLNAVNINSDVDSLALIDVIQQFENEDTIKFFYDKAWIDSVFVKQSNYSGDLHQLLTEIFTKAHLNNIIDGSNIILTRKYKVQTSLPANYFNSNRILPVEKPDSVNNQYAFLQNSEVDDVQIKSSNVVSIGSVSQSAVGTACVLSGVVRNEEDGEPIVGAQIYVEELGRGTITDADGYYVLHLPKRNHTLHFKYLGRKESQISVSIHNSGVLDVNLKKSMVHIREVTVTSEKENPVKNTNIGVQQLQISEIKQLPATLGEVDIVKTALLLPGVQTIGEGASGFNVRGGRADQNLILYDEIPVFNSSHLFGFFSVFNPETVKDFKLYKSGIPASFGGRVSSVFDVSATQGNLRKFVVSGGISPITGKLTIEGPIIKDKLSFIVGGRSTYSDWILKKIDSPQFQKTKARFDDFSAKLSYQMNKENTLSLTLYQSRDYFKLNSDTAYNYQNKCARLFYKHFFNPQFYTKVSAIYSNYSYDITSDESLENSFKLRYNIDYKSLKISGCYLPNSKHKVTFGCEGIRYYLTPGDFTPLSTKSDITGVSLQKEKGIETGAFFNDSFKPNSRLTISLGLRYALFSTLGPYKQYEYNSQVARSIDSRMDSVMFSKNKVVKTYNGPEFRLSTRYLLGENNSIKLCYNRLHQFLQMLTNSSAISPTDIWKICDTNIKPLIGDQISLGYYHNLHGGRFGFSAEAYYKKTINHLDYKNGTELLLNENLDVDLLLGKGRAYGVELQLKKAKGRLNGWISYTYSRAELKVNGQFSEEKINNGNYYPADYDKPHDLNLVANYKYSRRISVSNTFCYSTGRPITYPVAKYKFRDNELIHYSNRNEYRIPNYLRWDISLNLSENLKANKISHNSLAIGVYNVLGTNNAYSVYFKTTSKGVKGYKLSVFAQPIFNVTYNFRF